MLMKKLTRRANNRTPSLTTSEWTQLQSDMAALQSKVYRCIDKYTCCEVCLWWCCYQRVKIDFIYVDIECYNKSSTFAPHRGGFKCMLILNLIPTHIQPYLLSFIVVLMTIYKKKQPNSALYFELCQFSKIESQLVLEKKTVLFDIKRENRA